MKKTLITILIIVILGGLGYFVYSKGLIKLDFLKKGDSLIENLNTTNEVVKENEDESSKFSDVGESIQGDFNGDGEKEVATVVRVKEAQGGMDDGTPAVYEIQFSDKNIPSIDIDCCHAYLINEGDLDNDKKDDLSVYQSPHNGMTYTFSSYSLLDGKWNDLIRSFLIDIAQVSDDQYISLGAEELMGRVFKEGDSFAYIPDERIVKTNGKDFKVQLKVMPELTVNGENVFLTIYDESKKILEDKEESAFPNDSSIVTGQDFNSDGYDDIEWLVSIIPNGRCSTESMEFNILFLFNPNKNIFEKTDINTRSQKLKADSKYYFIHTYYPCAGVWESTLFTIENNKQVIKGQIRYNKNPNKPLLEIYKGSSLIGTLPMSKAEIYVNDFGESMPTPKLDERKYWEENYKKFE